MSSGVNVALSIPCFKKTANFGNALQPAFFHNGAFTRLEDAIRFHLNAAGQAPNYDPSVAGVAPDLRGPTGPIEPVISRLDPALVTPINLSDDRFRHLVDFVRNGLLDPKSQTRKFAKADSEAGAEWQTDPDLPVASGLSG